MRQERMVVLASQRRYAATGSPANRRRWPKPAIHHRSGDSLSPPAPARLDLPPALERMDVGMGVGVGVPNVHSRHGHGHGRHAACLLRCRCRCPQALGVM
jgi:hypothetical protein